MNKNLSFLILSAFLLIVQSQGGKIEETENLSTFSESRKAFQDAVIAKLLTLSEEPIKLGIKVVQDTYDDNSNNESVKGFFAGFLDEHRNIKTENYTDKISLYIRLSLIFDVINAPINDDSNDSRALLLVKEAFEKQDIKGVAIEFQKSYDEFLNWLLPEIDEHSHKFTAEEQLGVIEFKKVCKQFKEETNFDERRSAAKSLVSSLKK